VLFHLMTGRPPFEGEAPGDILSAHIREAAPAPSSRAPSMRWCCGVSRSCLATGSHQWSS
jgi:hypothetical protein